MLTYILKIHQCFCSSTINGPNAISSFDSTGWFSFRIFPPFSGFYPWWRIHGSYGCSQKEGTPHLIELFWFLNSFFVLFLCLRFSVTGLLGFIQNWHLTVNGFRVLSNVRHFFLSCLLFWVFVCCYITIKLQVSFICFLFPSLSMLDETPCVPPVASGSW